MTLATFRAVLNEEDDMNEAQAHQLSETLRIVASNEKRMDTLEANIAEIETRQGQLRDGRDAILVELRKNIPARLDAIEAAAKAEG
jgi:cell division protein FtsB